MEIELSIYEQQFIIDLFQNSYLKDITKKLIATATVHPDNEDYVEREITVRELKDLIGELSYEANHNRKKRISELSCEIADSLENQLWSAKRSE